jgi:uncharacterized membrane protein (Fun14 family)
MKKKLIKVLALILGLLGLSTCVIACYGVPPIEEQDLTVEPQVENVEGAGAEISG